MPKLVTITTNPMVLKSVELRPLSGEESNGYIIGAEGRASETLIIAFNRGPLTGKTVRLEDLPRDNRDLSKSVNIDMIGEICIVSGPAGR